VTVRADEFAPAEIIEELAEAVHALPEAQGPVPVHWETEDDLPRVRLDRLKVKEIVQNLVSNALKFTAEGEIRVRVGRRGDHLQIEVRDTGIGIPPEAQARVFDMFERVETPDGQRLPGVGLGLFIVHSLVGLMGGSIALRSTPGEGCVFTVELPLALDAAAA
jgi:signal transduction histidine kinase